MIRLEEKFKNLSHEEIVEEIRKAYIKVGGFRQLSRELGINKTTLTNFILKNNIEVLHKPKKQDRDLINQRFDKLLVIEKIPPSNNYPTTRWKCVCDCGKIISPRAEKLLNKTTRSCGAKCKLRTFGQNHHSYKGYKEITRSFFHHIEDSAKRREIEFSVSIEYLQEIWEKQNRKCAISGLALIMETRQRLKIKATASLDRIDSSKGYIEGNVWWVHKHVNIAKNSFPLSEFIEMCNNITDYYRNYMKIPEKGLVFNYFEECNKMEKEDISIKMWESSIENTGRLCYSNSVE